MDLSTRSLQLHKDDNDEGVDPSNLASTRSAATCATTLSALPGRSYSLPASLTGAGNSPSSLPARPLRPTAISPAGSPAPLKGVPQVCDWDSSSHSESGSSSSNCCSCSTVSRSHHSQCLDSFPTHAQHTQHAGRFDLDAAPQQTQQSTAGLSCDLSLVSQLPDLSQHWSPMETGAPTASAADVSNWAGPQEPVAAAARLTAQHIRQRYPHLFAPDCNTIPLQSASNAANSSSNERDLTSSLQVSPSTGLPGSATGVCGSSTCEDSPAPGASSFDPAAKESATCSTAVVSQGQGSDDLRARQAVIQQGLHAAALHVSPLRLLLKESNAAVAGAIQAGMRAPLPLTCFTAPCCSYYSLASSKVSRWDALLQLVDLFVISVNQSAGRSVSQSGQVMTVYFSASARAQRVCIKAFSFTLSQLSLPVSRHGRIDPPGPTRMTVPTALQ